MGQAQRKASDRPTHCAEQIEEDQLTKVAKAHWRDKPSVVLDADLIKRIYDTDLHGSAKTAPPLRTIMLLEVCHILVSTTG